MGSSPNQLKIPPWAEDGDRVPSRATYPFGGSPTEGKDGKSISMMSAKKSAAVHSLSKTLAET
jgi:hypothetical protein